MVDMSEQLKSFDDLECSLRASGQTLMAAASRFQTLGRLLNVTSGLSEAIPNQDEVIADHARTSVLMVRAAVAEANNAMETFEAMRELVLISERAKRKP